jgi:hypothetical protein
MRVVGASSRMKVLVPYSTLLASADVIPSLEASLLATTHWDRPCLCCACLCFSFLLALVCPPRVLESP